MDRDLKPNDFAGIWSEEEGYSFLVPVGWADNMDVPDRGAALIGAMLRLESDEEFRQECVNWLRAKTKSRS
jgi:hypothetical protein